MSEQTQETTERRRLTDGSVWTPTVGAALSRTVVAIYEARGEGVMVDWTDGRRWGRVTRASFRQWMQARKPTSSVDPEWEALANV